MQIRCVIPHLNNELMYVDLLNELNQKDKMDRDIERLCDIISSTTSRHVHKTPTIEKTKRHCRPSPY